MPTTISYFDGEYTRDRGHWSGPSQEAIDLIDTLEQNPEIGQRGSDADPDFHIASRVAVALGWGSTVVKTDAHKTRHVKGRVY